MTTQNRNFYKKIFNGVAFCASLIAVYATNCNAAVVSRSNSARPSAASSRMPTMTARIQSTATTPTTPDTTVTTETVEVAETPEIVADEPIIENKSSQFDEILDDASTPSSDASSTSLAEQIRAQRAALDASDATTTAKTAISGGQNVCDQNLRACMKTKCGNDFSKCAGDTDTLWGTKMDACRRDLPCTGTEYRMFAAEIRADRDMNARIASYNSIVECGNRYNNCIVTECGTKFNKCLGKSAGDAAISKCEKIARECTEMDSGLASRTMSVFGTLRQDAEVQVKRDEERLYALRDLMRDTCGRLGAMFDERTLDCVYTVNFYAGAENTLFASKKAYAGSAFDCTPNWFGVDVTTYMENAQRLTREQTSATSALMGSGIGMGVGAITSGAIDRAVDRHKAEQAVKQAEKEHNANYGKETTDTDNESVTESNDMDGTTPAINDNNSKDANTDGQNQNDDNVQSETSNDGDSNNDSNPNTDDSSGGNSK